MVKDLIKMAGELDRLGLKREADAIDSLIRKVAEEDSAYDPFHKLPKNMDEWTTEDWDEHDSRRGAKEPSYDPRRMSEGQLSLLDSLRPRAKRLKDMSPEERFAYLDSARERLLNMSDAKLSELWEKYPKKMEEFFGKGTLHEVRNPKKS